MPLLKRLRRPAPASPDDQTVLLKMRLPQWLVQVLTEAAKRENEPVEAFVCQTLYKRLATLDHTLIAGGPEQMLAESGPYVRLTNGLIAQAVDAGADGLRLSPGDDRLRVEHHRAGAWHDFLPPDPATENLPPLAPSALMKIARRLDEMAGGIRKIFIRCYGQNFVLEYTSQYPEYIMLRITPTSAR